LLWYKDDSSNECDAVVKGDRGNVDDDGLVVIMTASRSRIRMTCRNSLIAYVSEISSSLVSKVGFVLVACKGVDRDDILFVAAAVEVDESIGSRWIRLFRFLNAAAAVLVEVGGL